MFCLVLPVLRTLDSLAKVAAAVGDDAQARVQLVVCGHDLYEVKSDANTKQAGRATKMAMRTTAGRTVKE